MSRSQTAAWMASWRLCIIKFFSTAVPWRNYLTWYIAGSTKTKRIIIYALVVWLDRWHLIFIRDQNEYDYPMFCCRRDMTKFYVMSKDYDTHNHLSHCVYHSLLSFYSWRRKYCHCVFLCHLYVGDKFLCRKLSGQYDESYHKRLASKSEFFRMCCWILTRNLSST